MGFFFFCRCFFFFSLPLSRKEKKESEKRTDLHLELPLVLRPDLDLRRQGGLRCSSSMRRRRGVVDRRGRPDALAPVPEKKYCVVIQVAATAAEAVAVPRRQQPRGEEGLRPPPLRVLLLRHHTAVDPAVRRVAADEAVEEVGELGRHDEVEVDERMRSFATSRCDAC